MMMVISCQVEDGGKLQVSGDSFHVAASGGGVDITTAGVITCTIEDGSEEFKRLNLAQEDVVSFDGKWYSFSSENQGEHLHLSITENKSTESRQIRLSLLDSDLSALVKITQDGQ